MSGRDDGPVVGGRRRPELEPDDEAGCWVRADGAIIVDDATWDSWERERQQAVGRRRRSAAKPDWIAQILDRLKEPIYVAAGRVGTWCPVCAEPTAMAVIFGDDVIELQCVAGCAEADIVAALRVER